MRRTAPAGGSHGHGTLRAIVMYCLFCLVMHVSVSINNPSFCFSTVRQGMRVAPGMHDGASLVEIQTADGHALKHTLREIIHMLRNSPQLGAECISEGTYERPPEIPEETWHKLGHLLAAKEQASSFDGSRWVSMRLDGRGWGTMINQLRDLGVVGNGFSEVIGQAMQECCRAVMDEFKACIAYTYSDEVTLLLKSQQNLEDGPWSGYPYNGRMQKWVSVASSLATAIMNRKLIQLLMQFEIPMHKAPIAHFDCKASVHDDEDEAAALLLWRAFDCSVSCVHDACTQHSAPPEIICGSWLQKFNWLHDAQLLPLEPHEAYGSLFMHTLGKFECINSQTNTTTTVTRQATVHINDGANRTPRNLLNFLPQGFSMIPQEDDPRMSIRPGSFWRYAGPSGTNPARNQHDRVQDRRFRRRNRRNSIRRPR